MDKLLLDLCWHHVYWHPIGQASWEGNMDTGRLDLTRHSHSTKRRTEVHWQSLAHNNYAVLPGTCFVKFHNSKIRSCSLIETSPVYQPPNPFFSSSPSWISGHFNMTWICWIWHEFGSASFGALTIVLSVDIPSISSSPFHVILPLPPFNYTNIRSLHEVPHVSCIFISFLRIVHSTGALLTIIELEQTHSGELRNSRMSITCSRWVCRPLGPFGLRIKEWIYRWVAANDILWLKREKLSGYHTKRKALYWGKKDGIKRRGQSAFGERGTVHRKWVKRNTNTSPLFNPASFVHTVSPDILV